MNLSYRFAAAALLVAGPAFAQSATKPAPAKSKPAPAKSATAKPVAAKAKPAPAKPKPAIDIAPLSHAEKQGFSVLQVAAPDAAKFIADWKLGTGGKSATTRTVANKPLFTILIFRGCKASAAGKCDIVADFTITRPDGTINDENKGVTVWDKAAPADPKKPYLGDGALGYGVDDEGPFGAYRVVATVTDRVAGVTLTTEQTLTIAPGKSAKPAKPAAAKPVAPEPTAPAPSEPATAAPSDSPASAPAGAAEPPAK